MNSATRAAPLERLEQLCDAGSLHLFARNGGEERIAVVAGRGSVQGRPVYCYAQDFSVAGGSVGEQESEIVVDLLRESRRTRTPVVAFMESAGARLQEGTAALEAYGRIFHENVANAKQVPQISVITGTSAGGGCYSPALTDFVVMCEGTSMFLTGPGVVNEALHEEVTPDALGGTRVHARNGVCHFVAPDEVEAAALVRQLLSFLPQHSGQSPPRLRAAPPLPGDPAQWVPEAARKVYDIRNVIACLVDRGEFLEVSSRWAANVVTGFARLEGRVVGVVANQPRVFGGVIDVEASRKASGFVDLCDAFRMPLVVLVDTPGFMPGQRQESAGVIREGARLVHSFSAATVPRVTVIMRKAFGGAYIAMNSKSLGASEVLAWPNAEIGIMGARPAARILNRRQLVRAAEPDVALDRLATHYAQRHLSARIAANRGLIDKVIAPARSRSEVVAAMARRPRRARWRRTGWLAR